MRLTFLYLLVLWYVWLYLFSICYVLDTNLVTEDREMSKALTHSLYLIKLNILMGEDKLR